MPKLCVRRIITTNIKIFILQFIQNPNISIFNKVSINNTGTLNRIKL